MISSTFYINVNLVHKSQVHENTLIKESTQYQKAKTFISAKK